MWHLHDRLEDHLDEETCRAEIRSFTEYGQLIPALGRPVRERQGYDVELIYGARRLFVARHLNRPLLVELRDISDMEAIIAMDMENRQRRDLSPYERGLGYARWIRSGCFKSQDDMARALQVSASQVSRLLKLAKLPSVVVGAFDKGTDICETWGLDLADALEDPQKRGRAIQAARAIAAQRPRPPAREIYRRLLSSATRGAKLRQLAHDKVVKGEDGVPLFRVRQQSKTIALLLPMEKVPARCLQEIEIVVAQILERGLSSTRLSSGIVTEGRSSSIGAYGSLTV